MKIKICGLFRKEDITYVNEVLPDYIGFVFAGSRRRVSREKAGELKDMLDSRIKVVGVFVNADIKFITDLINDDIIDIVQLHGNETEDYTASLRTLLPEQTPVIKAFSIENQNDIECAEKFPCDFMLLDNGKGGTGKSFNWDILAGNSLENVFLAGGVTTDNISQAIAFKPYCIDISSGAETDGIKDKSKIIELVKAVRTAEKEINNG